MKRFSQFNRNIVFLIFLTIFVTKINAQAIVVNYQFTITNQQQVSPKIFEFDLLLLDTEVSSQIKIATVQAGIIVNPLIYNGGVVTASIVAGSSTMNFLQVPTSITFSQSSNTVKLAAKAPPGCLNGTVMSQDPLNPTRLCRIRLTNTVNWASNASTNLTFNFSTVPYPTKISEYDGACINSPLPVGQTNCFTQGLNLLLNTQQTKVLNLNLLLEGFVTPSGEMTQSFDETGPYFPAGISDVVNVGLAQVTFPYSVIYSKDSVSLSQNGLATCDFSIPYPLSLGPFYLVVNHRNSVETWSKFPVSFVSDTIFYNFSTGYGTAYNNNLNFIEGNYCIFTGDVNQDGIVDASDMILSENQASQFAVGYLNEDNNGDGLVDASDMSMIGNNSFNFVASYTPTSTIPEVYTGEISNIAFNSANCSGEVISQGSSVVIARGSCWSTSSNPIISGYHTTDGNGAGIFMSLLTDLLPNTTYYVRAYATNSSNTIYGNQHSFKTLIVPPILTTVPIIDITSFSAVGGGDISSDGGAPVTSRGICWSTIANPTLENQHTVDGEGTGDFISNLEGLTHFTTYFVRAYATNSIGTSYGNQQVFTTLPISPEVNTDSIFSISSNEMSISAHIVSNGGSAIISRGFCYGNLSQPTLDNDTVYVGGSSDSFTAVIQGLSPNLGYYFRAIALNSVGLSYGNELFAKTLVALPTVTTTEVYAISGVTATSGGTIHYNGGDSILARGICWGISPNPDLTGIHTAFNGGTGSFVSNLSWLSPATTYYVRAYATNSAGTSYGNQVLFTTLAVMPTVNNDSITGITPNEMIVHAHVLSDGGSSVTKRGFCYSVDNQPTINNDTILVGSGTGYFSAVLSGLLPNVSYHIRPFALNGVGLSYGGELMATTNVALPNVSTSVASAVTGNSAVLGGIVIGDGGDSSVIRGVCWDTITNPDLNDNHFAEGIGIGAYSVDISNLKPNSTYYYRAYASNSAGTTFGSTLNFTTLIFLPGTSVLDIDSNQYNSVMLGNQVWLTKNLRTNRYSNGDTIPQVENNTEWSLLTSGAWNWYNNNSQNDSVYGKLYNYYTVTNPANLCPTGYRVPSDLDWTELTNFLGGLSSAGGKMKEVGLQYWNSPNTGATNSSDFTARASGNRNPTGVFGTLGLNGTWWSSTESSSALAWYRSLSFNSASQTRLVNNKKYGFGVRCVRDIELPELLIDSISDIDAVSARISAVFHTNGDFPIISKGFCWDTIPNPTILGMHTKCGSGIGDYICLINELVPSTQYFVRSYAITFKDTTYSSQKYFSSKAVFNCGDSIYDARDGRMYGTVAIGNKCWMSQNLNIGTEIVGTIEQTNNNTIEKYCYGDIPSSCDLYGGLYQWDEMMNYTQASNSVPSGIQGICPSGSHIPSIAEYQVLINTLGGNNIAGGKMKEVGSLAWATPNTGASNSSGFSALPGGERILNGGYQWALEQGYFGTASLEGTRPYYVKLTYDSDGVFSGWGPFRGNYYGRSVRCMINQDNPEIVTDSVFEIGELNAKVHCSIIQKGFYPLTQNGVCYSTTQNPSLNDQIQVAEIGQSSFVCQIAGLGSNNNYYIRSYFITSHDTTFGNQLSFSTLGLPMITTDSISGISHNLAIGGGLLSTNGGCPILQKGVCWGTVTNPTLSNPHSISQFDSVFFQSSIINLLPNTKYYVRSFATNRIGTSYGNELSFTTTSFSPYYIGQSYGGGIIFYIDSTGQGGLLAAPTDQKSYYEYECFPTSCERNSIGIGNENTIQLTNCSIFEPGHSYAAHYCSDLELNGFNDWFLPSKDELNLMYINLKNAGLGNFWEEGYWSSSIAFLGDEWGAWSQNFLDGVTHKNVLAIHLVRAVRSFGPYSVPSAICNKASSFSTSAKLNGRVNGHGFNTKVEFEYGMSTDYGHSVMASQDTLIGNTTFSVSANISGLELGTTYHYRIKATNELGTTYSNDSDFIAFYGIGEDYEGGKVFYVDSTWIHGLVAAPNISGGCAWGCNGIDLNGADGIHIGSGRKNTLDIINGCFETNIAAKLSSELIINNYDDWFLPSKDELSMMIKKLYPPYSWIRLWSSSEVDENNVWIYDYYMFTGGIKVESKLGEDGNPTGYGYRSIREY